MLAKSLAKHHPELELFVLLTDDVTGSVDSKNERFSAVKLTDLTDPSVFEMAHRYEELAFTRSLIATAMQHTLDQGFSEVLFLRHDLVVTGQLDRAVKSLKEHPIVLTPQLLSPLDSADAAEREQEILIWGVYDAGFVGVSDSEQGRAFLRWWADRLVENCHYDVIGGLNWEQTWLNLVPSYFPDTYIDHEPTRNVRRQRDDRLARLRRRLRRGGMIDPPRFPAPEKSSPRPAIDIPRPQIPAAPAPRGSIAFCTVFCKNHLAQARVIAQSLAEHHPEIEMIAVLADHPEGHFDPSQEAFEILSASDVGYPPEARIPEGETFMGLAPPMKPYILEHLLNRGYDSAVYIDTDVLVLDRIDDVIGHVSNNPIVLTPHLYVSPTVQDAALHERAILVAGRFNAGFIGVSEDPQAREFLSWWKARMLNRCRLDLSVGLNHDQRWLDLVPAFFDRSHSLLERDINVGHWNLPESLQDGVRVLHLSGYEPNGELFSKWSAPVRRDSLGSLATRLDEYDRQLMAAGNDEIQKWPFTFDPKRATGIEPATFSLGS